MLQFLDVPYVMKNKLACKVAAKKYHLALSSTNNTMSY